MKDKPNKITTVLKVVVTGEFYDDDATEETLRYAVEQDLEDAGFDVDVSMLKEQQPKTGKWIPKGYGYGRCSECGATVGNRYVSIYCHRCGSRNQQQEHEG